MLSIEKRKEKLLSDIKEYIGDEEFKYYQLYLSNIDNKKDLANIIKSKEEEIDSIKSDLERGIRNISYVKAVKETKPLELKEGSVGNISYATDTGETYYSNVEEDNRTYDPTNEKDAKEIDDALNKATENYNYIEPLELKNYEDYKDLTKVNIILDSNIGYRVVEDKNGPFRGILKESTWYVYPSEDLNLTDSRIVDICNILFNNKSKNGKYSLNDELELDNVKPAQIFSPYMAVVDDPINKLTNAEIFITEGLAVDENFKDSRFKDTNVTLPKNKIISKGKILSKKIPTELNETYDLREDLVVEPTKFIDGTFIPYPRKKRDNESEKDYEDYLYRHYAEHGYVTLYNEDGTRKRYPHEIKVDNEETSDISDQDEDTRTEYSDLNKFLDDQYGGVNFANNEISVQIAYLKVYKRYLEEVLKNKPQLKDTINSDIKDTTDLIETLLDNRVLR